MVEDTIAKVERQIRERQAREAAEAERLKQAMAAKATMTYGPEIGQAICDAIAEGAVLKELCRCEDFPTHKLLRQWIAERPGFAAALKEAERVRLFAWEDEC